MLLTAKEKVMKAAEELSRDAHLPGWKPRNTIDVHLLIKANRCMCTLCSYLASAHLQC